MRALESSIADGHRLFLEVGPHPVLTPSIREYIARNKVEAEVVSTLVRETDECKNLYHSLASLYTAGSNLNWAAINGRPDAMLTLPSYPWQRETHWGEAETALEERVGSVSTALPGRRLDMHEPVWERHINNKYLPYIDDHVVQKLVLLPGAAFVDGALSLQNEVGRAGMPVAVEDLHFRQPLVLGRNQDVVLRTALEPHSLRVRFYSTSQRQTSWTRHAEARLSQRLLTRPAPIDLDSLQNRLRETSGVDALYSRLTKLGLDYGPSFRRITELRANDREVLAKLKAGDAIEGYDIEHVLHPTLLDGAFQSLLAPIRGDETGFVPASIGQVAVFEQIPDELWCYGQITRQDDEAVVGDIFLLDNEGRVLSTVSELRCARIGLAASGKMDVIERLLLRPTWYQTPLEASKRRVGSWLIIAEGGFADGTFTAHLADGLRREGCDRVIPICVDTPEAEGSAASDITGGGTVRTPADWKNLFENYPPQGLAGIAYITRHAGANNPESAIGHAGHLLELFKHLPANDSNLRAYLITHRAQAVERADLVDGFLQASAAGFFRVAHNEYPALTCSMIDHDGDDAAHVVAELLADNEADDIALRAGVRYTQRIEACALRALEIADLAQRAVTPPSNGRYILACTVSGLAATADPHSDQLYWKQDTSPDLADDEVEIKIAYSRDHVRGSGQREVTSHELARPKWREFSGRISRVGSSVSTWRPGEPIAAAALCHLASHVVVRETDLRAIKLSAAPSIGSSSLAITAASIRAALQEMARAKPGETVLVIGEAQDELAQMFAVTAMDLGLDFLVACTGENASSETFDEAPMDLRSDDFEHRVLAANHGRPLDIIVFCGTVNPALHNRIPLSFGGRVVLYGPESESVDPNHFVDPATMYSVHRVNPTVFVAAGALYRAALAHLTNSTIRTVAPDRLCSADELPRASLDSLGSSRTLTFDMSALPNVVPLHVGQVMIDPEAAYVVTGGFGGFGMVVADHLVAQGARNVVLIGRFGATTDQTKRQIAEWRAQGVTIREALIDIANLHAIDKFFAALAAQHRVKGIIHAAGIVDDIRIDEMTSDKLIRVMRPKVHGAWNLHVCSVKHKLPLEHFVLFSSGSALVGNRGQANYVAANAVLDSLAAYRRARGLPSTSINWGALGEVGMAAEEDLRRQFELMGITPFSPDDAMAALASTLRFQPTQIGIMDVDWVQWGKFEPTGGKSLRFAHLTGARNGSLNASVSDSLRHLPAEERFDILELMLAEKIAQTLRIPPERIDVKQPLTDMGVDSLMAVQLQIAVNMAFGVEFSAFELTSGLNIRQLTTPLLERMGLLVFADVNRRGQSQTTSQLPALDELNETDLEKLVVLPQLPGNVAAQQLAL
jgi:NAD(P)-dependent dehydrogenase (short-subunit alcohol dehydrogenase family)/acyl carrier protein